LGEGAATPQACRVSRGFVFETSTLLAPLLREPGGDVVLEAVGSGLPVLLSAVNLAEAIGLLQRRRGLPPSEARADILSLGLEVVAFDAEQAQEVGSLEPLLRNSGVAFGDHACLMLGRVRSLPVLTADRTWAALDLGVEVRLIR
jgi:ribonuclease VapC